MSGLWWLLVPVIITFACLSALSLVHAGRLSDDEDAHYAERLAQDMTGLVVTWIPDRRQNVELRELVDIARRASTGYPHLTEEYRQALDALRRRAS